MYSRRHSFYFSVLAIDTLNLRFPRRFAKLETRSIMKAMLSTILSFGIGPVFARKWRLRTMGHNRADSDDRTSAPVSPAASNATESLGNFRQSFKRHTDPSNADNYLLIHDSHVLSYNKYAFRTANWVAWRKREHAQISVTVCREPIFSRIRHCRTAFAARLLRLFW